MATVNELKATSRPKAGKGAARAVRREGRVPGVIYGDNQPPLNISLDFKELTQRIFAGRFLTSILTSRSTARSIASFRATSSSNPVRDHPIHVDFLRLGEGATIRVRIPIHVANVEQAPGIKRGGTVNIVTHTVEVRCPADAIPEAIEVDHQRAGDQPFEASERCPLPPNVRPLVQPMRPWSPSCRRRATPKK